MTASQLFAAAHAETRRFRQHDKSQAYAQVFAPCLRGQYGSVRNNKRRAALAAAPAVKLVLRLTYGMVKAQQAAKAEGFRYDGATKTWSKVGKLHEVGSYLRSLVEEQPQATAPAAAASFVPGGATREQRRHFATEQGVFGASVSWGDCF